MYVGYYDSVLARQDTVHKDCIYCDNGYFNGYILYLHNDRCTVSATV